MRCSRLTRLGSLIYAVREQVRGEFRSLRGVVPSRGRMPRPPGRSTVGILLYVMIYHNLSHRHQLGPCASVTSLTARASQRRPGVHQRRRRVKHVDLACLLRISDLRKSKFAAVRVCVIYSSQRNDDASADAAFRAEWRFSIQHSTSLQLGANESCMLAMRSRHNGAAANVRQEWKQQHCSHHGH